MCSICEQWESGKIDSKQAYKLISKEMSARKNMAHMLKLSERILTKEVPPPTEADPAKDAEWQARNGKAGGQEE